MKFSIFKKIFLSNKIITLDSVMVYYQLEFRALSLVRFWWVQRTQLTIVLLFGQQCDNEFDQLDFPWATLKWTAFMTVRIEHRSDCNPLYILLKQSCRDCQFSYRDRATMQNFILIGTRIFNTPPKQIDCFFHLSAPRSVVPENNVLQKRGPVAYLSPGLRGRRLNILQIGSYARVQSCSGCFSLV